MVIWAMATVARRFFSWPDLISQVLLVAIVLNVLVYVPSTLADATDLNAREFAVVLPFGAVLAGRALAARRAWRTRLALAPRCPVARRFPLAPRCPLASRCSLARRARGRGSGPGDLASLGYAPAQPSVPPANDQLTAFLAEHHLTDGVAG